MKKIILLLAPLLLTGCGSLTGFSNAQTDFSCSGKDGEPSCRTISEVFASGGVKASSAVDDEDEKASSGYPHITSNAPSVPWRTPEKVMRVWMAPFTDAQGDLHDQRYLFVRIKEAGWDASAVSDLAKSREAFRPVYPLEDPNKAADEPKKRNTVDPAQLLPLLGKGA